MKVIQTIGLCLPVATAGMLFTGCGTYLAYQDPALPPPPPRMTWPPTKYQAYPGNRRPRGELAILKVSGSLRAESLDGGRVPWVDRIHLLPGDHVIVFSTQIAGFGAYVEEGHRLSKDVRGMKAGKTYIARERWQELPDPLYRKDPRVRAVPARWWVEVLEE